MHQRVIIVSKQGATTGDAFYPWLTTALAQQAPVSFPKYLRPETPRLEEWAPIVLAQLWETPERAVLVAHGIGCRAALHALSRLREGLTVGGLVCVAPDADREAMNTLSSTWRTPIVSMERANGVIQGRCVILTAGQDETAEQASWLAGLQARTTHVSTADLRGPEAPSVLQAVQAMLTPA